MAGRWENVPVNSTGYGLAASDLLQLQIKSFCDAVRAVLGCALTYDLGGMASCMTSLQMAVAFLACVWAL